jgi:hypothetical protein
MRGAHREVRALGRALTRCVPFGTRYIRFWLLMQLSLLTAVPPQLAPLSSEPVRLFGVVDGVHEAAKSAKAMRLQRATFEKVIFEASLV